MHDSQAQIDNPLSQETFFAEKHTKSRVDVFRRKCQHPLSSGLPENSFITTRDYTAYRSVLPDYETDWDTIGQYDKAHPDSRKTDFLSPNNPNLAWKVHLNAIPENVSEISKYLNENGYNHKYLSGGELEDGKVFTIYIGSIRLVTDLSSKLTQDIGHLLAKPTAHNEVEFAPGVVGRFVASGAFDKVGNPVEFSTRTNTCGYVWTKEQSDKYLEFAHLGPKDDPKYKSKLAEMRVKGEEESFRVLQQIFGKYFYDDGVASVPRQ